MEPKGNLSPGTRDKDEMRELVRSTFAALDESSMPTIVNHLRDRVFTRHPDELLDATCEDGICRWSFKPMVELMLRHIRDLAHDARVPDDERPLEIAATIELAGF